MRGIKASVVAGLVLLLPVTAVPAEEVIRYQDWVRLKTATAVLQLPALQRVVGRLGADPGSIIVIQYPGGDEGTSWAEDLRNWLVSLGIGSDEIRLEPGSGVPGAIVLRNETGG